MSLATTPDSSYLGFGFSSLTRTINISFVISTYLHVILFACLSNCFVGGVIVGGSCQGVPCF